MKALRNLLFSTLIVLSSNPALAGAPGKQQPTNAPKPGAGMSVTVSPLKIKPQAKPFEVTGEVVDSWCYASKVVGEGRGPEHAKCADACAHGGVTLGIVDDAGNLYIASKTKAYTGCQHLLEPFVAKRVHVKGWIARTGGCQLLKIETVEEVKDSKTSTKSKK